MGLSEGLTRRRFLRGALAAATTLELQRAARALGFAADAEVCKLLAEQEVGPYYVAGELLRQDIVEGKAGVPLALRIAVLDVRTCKPLTGAAVDIWHCDALGMYSGYTTQSMMQGGPGGPPPGGFSGPGGPPESHPTDKLTFLRGIQMTDADGAVRFRTVFPGFYMGRTNHIHFKVRLGGHAEGKTYAAGHTSHVGQVFFPEQFAANLMEHEPYSKHKIHRTRQGEDDVFNDQHGELSIARLTPVGAGGGYVAELVAAVDPTATPAPADRRGGPDGGPGGRPGGPPPAGQ